MPSTDNIKRFTLKETAIEVHPSFWLNLLPLLGGLAWLAGWRRPQRSWPARLLVAALTAPLAVIPDVGHAFGHLLSARAARAPVKTLRLAAGMPRTLYPRDLVVSPKTHRRRASGGPLFNLVGLLLSLFWRQQTAPDSLAREAADVSTLANGFLCFGSLLPLPVVDGGSLLKWSLVERGYAPPRADRVISNLNSGLGAGLVALAGLFLLLGRRVIALLLAAAGSVGLAAGQGMFD